jgi:hypothetical protein
MLQTEQQQCARLEKRLRELDEAFAAGSGGSRTPGKVNARLLSPRRSMTTPYATDSPRSPLATSPRNSDVDRDASFTVAKAAERLTYDSGQDAAGGALSMSPNGDVNSPNSASPYRYRPRLSLFQSRMRVASPPSIPTDASTGGLRRQRVGSRSGSVIEDAVGMGSIGGGSNSGSSRRNSINSKASLATTPGRPGRRESIEFANLAVNIGQRQLEIVRRLSTDTGLSSEGHIADPVAGRRPTQSTVAPATGPAETLAGGESMKGKDGVKGYDSDAPSISSAFASTPENSS